MAPTAIIGKKKGILIVRDLLHAGHASTYIEQYVVDNCGKSARTAQQWIKSAKPLVQQMLDHDEIVRQQTQDKLTQEAAEKNSVTKERLVARLAEIVFGDVSGLFNNDKSLKPISEWTDSNKALICGIETISVGTKGATLQKVKTINQVEAAKLLADILGYKAPVKSEVTEKKLKIGYGNQSK